MVVAIGMADRIRFGYETIHCRACMPPMEPPMTDSSFSMCRASIRCCCALTMSWMLISGKLRPYGLPVCGFIEDGPVDPWQPPITLLQIT